MGRSCPLNYVRDVYMCVCVCCVQLAVCVIELWPEARACRNDRSLALGITIGSLLMGWTLAVEG